jgi:hypothetical protein
MDYLGGDDVVRDAAIEEMLQAVFSASPLGGYIIRPTKLSSVSAVSAVQWNGASSSKQLSLANSYGRQLTEGAVEGSRSWR